MGKIITCTLINSKDYNDQMAVTVMSEASEIKPLSNIISKESPIGGNLIEAIIKKKEKIECNNIFYQIRHLEIYPLFYELYPRISSRIVDCSLQNRVYDIYIYDGVSRCKRKAHEIECVVANVNSLRDRYSKISIDVKYCKQCKKYFMSIRSLEGYEEIHGTLLIRRINDHEHKSYYRDYLGRYDNRNDQSTLYQYGYNVRKNGMKSRDRKILLDTLIRYRIMYKADIEDWLEFLIAERVGRHDEAVAKWREDLIYVNNYDMLSERHINGRLIR